jgi:cell wall-associated NlpC family hydrolase
VRCAESDLDPGDLVFYGRTTAATPAFPIGSPTHVAVYDGDGGVYSQGGPHVHDRMKRHPVKSWTINHHRHY